MTLLAAAVVPSAPLLVPGIAGGIVPLDDVLRSHVLAVVAQVLAAGAPIMVVAAAPTSGWQQGTWDWRGFGVDGRGGDGPALPLGLALGAYWLDALDAGADRRYLGIAHDAAPSECAARGRELVQKHDFGLLVVADGSARRSEKAPGHLDPRAADFDAEVEAALRTGSPERLAGLEAAQAAALLAAGRPAWQVLAGAAAGATWSAEVPYADAPYGVAYFVASWTRA